MNKFWLFTSSLGIGLTLTTTSVSALTITRLPYSVGGNPGDLGIVNYSPYEVSGLFVGDSVNLTWGIDGRGDFSRQDTTAYGNLPNLSAVGNLTITGLTSNLLTFTVNITNNTPNFINGNYNLNAPITSFGLEVEGVLMNGRGRNAIPSARLINTPQFLKTYNTGNIAGGGGLSTDFCATTNKCNQGNPASGINIGQSDSLTFAVDLSSDFTSSGVTLRHFATKWQTNYDDFVSNPDDGRIPDGDNSSFELAGIVTPPVVSHDDSPQPVPEPMTILGTILAGGLGYFAKKTKNNKKV